MDRLIQPLLGLQIIGIRDKQHGVSGTESIKSFCFFISTPIQRRFDLLTKSPPCIMSFESVRQQLNLDFVSVNN